MENKNVIEAFIARDAPTMSSTHHYALEISLE